MRILNELKIRKVHYLKRVGLYEHLVLNGIIGGWFKELQDYWTDSLRREKLSLIDFYQLHLKYSADPDRQEVALLFYNVLKYAMRPVWEARLSYLLKPGMKVLEFGCGIAPLYRTYRTFFNHIKVEWYLADVENILLKFARYTYMNDRGLGYHHPKFLPKEKFDVVIVHEVFEHLPQPLATANDLLDCLKPGGLLYFTYLDTDGTGLDTLAGKVERGEVLILIATETLIISGTPGSGVCIGRKGGE